MADFNLIYSRIFKHEGGYSTDKNDIGNYLTTADFNARTNFIGTKYGVAAVTLQTYLKRIPTAQDMKNLTPATAKYIMKTMFWDTCKGDLINNQAIAEFIVNWFWGSGYTAIAWVNGVMKKYFNVPMPANTLVISNDAVKKINSVNQAKLYDALYKENIIYYKQIATGVKAQYLQPWLNRIKDFYESNKKYITDTGGALVVLAGATGIFF